MKSNIIFAHPVVYICKRVQVKKLCSRLIQWNSTSLIVFGVKELHVSVTSDHLHAVHICDLKQVVLCGVYTDGYKRINILLKASVL
jgi:hypothetical protein